MDLLILRGIPPQNIAFLFTSFILPLLGCSPCSPEMEAPYSSAEEKMRLLDLYRYMHSRIHSSSRPLKLIYHVAERETLLAWVRTHIFPVKGALSNI